MFYATVLIGVDFMFNFKIMVVDDSNIDIIISLSSLIL